MLNSEGRASSPSEPGDAAARSESSPYVPGCVCGFAICPSRGAQITAAEMDQAISGILSLGVPTALYQLPQVTQNEMSPALVADLAGRYPNFILFKRILFGFRAH